MAEPSLPCSREQDKQLAQIKAQVHVPTTYFLRRKCERTLFHLLPSCQEKKGDKTLTLSLPSHESHPSKQSQFLDLSWSLASWPPCHSGDLPRFTFFLTKQKHASIGPTQWSRSTGSTTMLRPPYLGRLPSDRHDRLSASRKQSVPGAISSTSPSVTCLAPFYKKTPLTPS